MDVILGWMDQEMLSKARRESKRDTPWKHEGKTSELGPVSRRKEDESSQENERGKKRR